MGKSGNNVSELGSLANTLTHTYDQLAHETPGAIATTPSADVSDCWWTTSSTCLYDYLLSSSEKRLSYFHLLTFSVLITNVQNVTQMCKIKQNFNITKL